MFRQLRLAAFVVVALVVVTSCGRQENKESELKIGTAGTYPPFEFRDGDKMCGLAMDVSRAVARDLGRKATFEEMPFTLLLPALQTGSIDIAVSSFSITPEREKKYGMSIPYYYETLAVIYRKDTPILSKADFAGKKIACCLGSTMEMWARKNAPTAEITPTDTTPMAIEALKTGRADAVLTDAAQASVYSKENKTLWYKVLERSGVGLGIVVKKSNKELLNAVNASLKKMVDSGELKKIQDKWVDTSVDKESQSVKGGESISVESMHQ
ncbi:substrate-binding periplasmic protein [Candidatus Hydrogenosomobacter endosymbioticus]|uniref:Amino acid ABC transporter substrate-binding protein n=1 Tax=Candidatus Hydrogenosomobacter endosymbioticus TaxID=2558174 RepID=A0ABM7VAE6_9PROT|nr:ABC transporter substrate-binding protein [Candidatus Hydrogenosomobacter endosymbioticus]BDB96474.1 amino acid ABC transporter substrate-binding protein [Candidatus Hydrogenosomobacter endosymbioticus]